MTEVWTEQRHTDWVRCQSATLSHGCFACGSHIEPGEGRECAVCVEVETRRCRATRAETEAEVIAAWQTGALSRGQAAQLLDCVGDPVWLRERLAQIVARCQMLWEAEAAPAFDAFEALRVAAKADGMMRARRSKDERADTAFRLCDSHAHGRRFSQGLGSRLRGIPARDVEVCWANGRDSSCDLLPSLGRLRRSVQGRER